MLPEYWSKLGPLDACALEKREGYIICPEYGRGIASGSGYAKPSLLRGESVSSSVVSPGLSNLLPITGGSICTILGEGNSVGSAGDVEATKFKSSGTFLSPCVNVSSPT